MAAVSWDFPPFCFSDLFLLQPDSTTEIIEISSESEEEDDVIIIISSTEDEEEENHNNTVNRVWNETFKNIKRRRDEDEDDNNNNKWLKL